MLSRDPSGLELRADPAGLAPERLLVFEVRGAISAFAAAIRNVSGLELIDEEDLESDEEDKAPTAYLMVPDVRALREIERLWDRWLKDNLKHGETPWRNVFETLRDLRPWGPNDRVQSEEAETLGDIIGAMRDEERVRLEIELVFRFATDVGAAREVELRTTIEGHGGKVVSVSRIEEVAYHAMLVELPVPVVRQIVARSPEGLAGLESIMHIRPQSTASMIEIAESHESDTRVAVGPLGTPILALLDGVPVAAHQLLRAHVVIDDQFDLEPTAPVTDRVHGTAMASLIIHGDRNRNEGPLPRRVHVVPVLGKEDGFPSDRLVVDVIFRAVLSMKEGRQPAAPDVLIVNLSLGNPRRVFHGQMSAWARLLDRMAYRFGLLFIVSAGNHTGRFAIPAFASHSHYEDAEPSQRAAETLRALGAIVANRRLLSPAETVNGITVGACNVDAVSSTDRASSRVNVDPYGELEMSNPSSALGPGFGLAVKPDLLMPGAREHLRFSRNHSHIEVQPAGPGRNAGLRVASPPRNGQENQSGYTNGTSAAAALASRTAHRIHDALEAAYGDDFRQIPNIQRAVLLKALLAHPAIWPDGTATLIREVIGPSEGKFHVQQKDNIRRFLGYGIVDAEVAVACAGDRATFWATGALHADKIVTVPVPVPISMAGQARPHSLSATLAWFTPTSPGRRSYRSARLKILEPSELDSLNVKAHSDQPDGNQTKRGTLYTRRWSGERAPAFGANMEIQLTIQRDPDQGAVIDEAIPFGLAVTLTMPGVIEIYEQARQRLGIMPRAQA